MKHQKLQPVLAAFCTRSRKLNHLWASRSRILLFWAESINFGCHISGISRENAAYLISFSVECVVIRTSLVLSAKILALRLGGTKEVVRTKAFTPWHAVLKSEAPQAPREEMPQTSDASF